MDFSQEASNLIFIKLLKHSQLSNSSNTFVRLEFLEKEFLALYKNHERYLEKVPSFKNLWIRFFLKRCSIAFVLMLPILGPSIDSIIHHRPFDLVFDLIFYGIIFLITLAPFVFSFKRQINLIVKFSVKRSIKNGLPLPISEQLKKQILKELTKIQPLKKISFEIYKEVCKKSHLSYEETLNLIGEQYQERLSAFNTDTSKVTLMLSKIKSRKKHMFLIWFTIILIISFLLIPELPGPHWKRHLVAYIKISTFLSLPFLWQYFRPRSWIIEDLIERANKLLKIH